MGAAIDGWAWWRLLRAANVFTAASNVIAGFLLVNHDWQPVMPLLFLILTSVLLYEAGMVLNDVCDAELDAVERPERPIPSQRISKKTALNVGIGLLIGGVLSACGVTWLTGQWRPVQVALALAATIVGYDVGAKSTRFGPLVMGSCRTMNVLLGSSMAATTALFPTAIWLFAWGTFFHTYGLTRIARHEADSIDHADLWAGCASILIAPIWIAGLPFAMQDTRLSLLAWGAICLLLFAWEIRLAQSLLSRPINEVVRQTVGRLIMQFIVIDAAVSALAAGWAAGIAVLALLVPTLIMSRKIAMT